MSYEPTTWVTGDIITATKLNNIESGVQSVSSSYTPTTWATGDIITATKLNNIEQGIANAGGGSSDLSTATVTVNNVDGESTTKIFSTAILDNAITSLDLQGSGGEFLVPLYKGTCIWNLYEGSATLISGTANIRGRYIIIGGDCTIETYTPNI